MFNFINFKNYNVYYYLFAFMGITSILIILYFWRRISNLINLNNTLEKKNVLLKKELNDINNNKNNNNNNDEILNSDNIMNEIFTNNPNNNDLNVTIETFESNLSDNNNKNNFVNIHIMDNKNLEKNNTHNIMQNDLVYPNISNKINNQTLNNNINTNGDNINFNNTNESNEPNEPNESNEPNKSNEPNDTIQINHIDKNIDDFVEKIIEPNNDDIVSNNKLVNLPDNNEINDNNSIISDKININQNTYTKNKLNKLTIEKLREICNNNGYSTDGTKQILIEKILNK